MSDEDEFNPWMDALLATTKQLEQMRAERDEARRERDEARRIVCDIMEGGGWETKEQVADQRGWDCYREKP